MRSHLGETQVMTFMEEAGDEGVTLTTYKARGDSAQDGHINSCNKLDARIHVNLKEPLVSASPEMGRSSNSCLPVSLRGCGYSTLEEEVFEEDTHTSFDCSVATFPASCSAPEQLSVQTACACGDTQKRDKDLINLSDSPVVKTQKKSGDKGEKHFFSNDLLLEDLETADVSSLDEVKISYPSKNPFLPLLFSASSENSRLSDVGYLPAQQQGNHLQCPPESVNHHQWHELHLLLDQHYGQLIELKHFTSDSAESESALHSQSVQPAFQSENGSASAKAQLDLKAGCQGLQSAGCRLPHHKGNCLYKNTSLQGKSRSQPQESGSYCQQIQSHPDQIQSQFQHSQSQPQQSSNGRSLELQESSAALLIGTGSFEAETSFIQKSDPLPNEQSRMEPGPESSIKSSTPAAADHTFSGKSVAAAQNYLTVLDSGAVGEWEKDAGKNADAGADELCAGAVAGLSEPFLLVIGGRTAEVGSMHRKPIAMWKGVFL